MRTLQKIKKILEDHKIELRYKFKVKDIGIFGSYARGEQKSKSDIDLLVEFEEPVSLLKLVSLENFLREMLKVKVEVIPKKDVRPELREKIFKEVIYI
ncbi:MAG: nucleotidyltransferase family protein [candidate division Zixibacteria bacterium]|jgi:hypothetical protein|nr:nucleotidyltransferase family protein [candidate division Zixibacteria bacterium]